MKNERLKNSFDRYVTSKDLPSEQTKKRILQYENPKQKIKRGAWLSAMLSILLISCFLLLISVRPTLDEKTPASIAAVEAQLNLYLSLEERLAYTALFEDEEPIRLILVEGHPLTKSEIRQLEQMGVDVDQQFIWPRFPFSLTLIVWLLTVSLMAVSLFCWAGTRLKVYIPFILSSYTLFYCAVGTQISEGYSGIYYIFISWLASAIAMGSVVFILVWEWRQKKARNG